MWVGRRDGWEDERQRQRYTRNELKGSPHRVSHTCVTPTCSVHPGLKAEPQQVARAQEGRQQDSGLLPEDPFHPEVILLCSPERSQAKFTSPSTHTNQRVS